MPVGPLEAFDLLEEMYDEFKFKVEGALQSRGVKYYIDEYPPSPFETYAKMKFRFYEPTKVKIHYTDYTVFINDVPIKLTRDVKLFMRIDSGPTLLTIPFTPRFLLYSENYPMPLYSEDVRTPKELIVKELWVTISSPMVYSRILHELIRAEKFWVEIRTY